ncbi:MAG: DUF1697 domain-containing protein, partial [Actinomycetes bacterium]|nr:DUF1697 domain-containing protein [Actinomycetes bacterium]MDX5399290.1 DUF1697 domain-containing protein [Actinomycetes bacterium]MDX5450192.1 DUF1697 domain-containing protein [Actinomycetes bacterium]
MPSYVAFLRAINLGRNRAFPMADVRACLERAGFRDVETYIQTGNVRVGTSMRSVDRVAAALEEVFEADRGFAVPTVVLTPAELTAVHRDARALELLPDAADARRYVTFLKQEPDPEAAAELEAWDVEGERAAVRGRALHWWLAKPTVAARLSNAA